MSINVEKIPSLIKDLYRIVYELQTLFPGRPFTPDGHLVGSIGEVLAAHFYNLTLLPPSSLTHDAISLDGRKYQIKATQGKAIGLRSEPEFLLVLKLEPDGSFSELYNGLGKIAWDNCGKLQKNGQRPIRVSKLQQLMKTIDQSYILKRIQ